MRKPPCKQRELVWVWWRDAMFTRHADDEKAACALNCNLGWLAGEDLMGLLLHYGTSNSGEHDTLVIPKENVLEIRPVLAPRRRGTQGRRQGSRLARRAASGGRKRAEG